MTILYVNMHIYANGQTQQKCSFKTLNLRMVQLVVIFHYPPTLCSQSPMESQLGSKYPPSGPICATSPIGRICRLQTGLEVGLHPLGHNDWLMDGR